MTDTTQLATIPFGTRDEVKELQQRIITMLPSLIPNSTQLLPAEALALAQVALAHGLSPFNNEIYYLKAGDKNLGVFPGIRGYRKAAHRQIKRDGGTYWIEFIQSNPRDYNGEDGDICEVCFLRDSVTMGEYLRLRAMIYDPNRLPPDILKLSKEESASLESLKAAIEKTANEILGQPPIVYGIGIVKKFELENRIKKSGLNSRHIAKIRAERAALRQRFDLDLVFGSASDETWQEVDAIDANAEAIEQEAAVKEAPRTTAENLKELGFGAQHVARS